MAVFTAFFCGTGSNSFDFANVNYYSGELVSTLARHAAGLEFVDWIIADGPGSGNYQEDEKFVEPGYYSAARGGGFGTGWEENVSHALAMIHGEAKWSRKQLTELGYGVLKAAGVAIPDAREDFDLLGQPIGSIMPDRKVTQQALQMQKIKIFRRNHPITQINAIGWSRGAVTTHMFANALAADPTLRNIPVNLIAVDPVPGPGNFQLNRTSIPTNVRNYVAFYARDERSMGFAATLPTIPRSVRATIYPMPGRHATLVGNAGNYIGGNGQNVFYGPGKVVRMLSEKYLTDWGTRLNQCLPYSEMEMLRCYDEMVAQNPQFMELRKTVYTTSIGQGSDRDISVGQNWLSSKFQSIDQLKSSGPFINWHHAELFHHFGGLGGLTANAANTRRAVRQYLQTRTKAIRRA